MLVFSDLHSMYAVMVSVAKKVIVFFRGPRGRSDHPGWCSDFVYIIRWTGLFTKGGKMWVHQIKCNAEIDIYVGFDGLVEM